MKKFMTIAVFLFSINAVSEVLKTGFCRPELHSKVYIQNDFEQGFPREVIFTCKYKCMLIDGVKDFLGTTRTSISNQRDDAYKTTCQGVRVKPVFYGYDFDGVEDFYIHDSDSREIKNWAYENIGFNFEEEKKKLLKLKENLNQIIKGYEVAAQSGTEYAPIFAKARELLLPIYNELPNKTAELNSALDQIVDQDGVIGDINKSEQMALTALKALTKWRLPYFKNTLF